MWGRKRKASRLDKLEAQLATLAQENEDLRQQVAELEGKRDPVPGLEGGKAPRTILVGGEEVELRPLSPRDYMAAMKEIPLFITAHAKAKVAGEDEITIEQMEALVERAKQWIQACAVGEVKVERLTIPEAQHALVIIADMNGLSGQLREFFRQRLTLGTPAVGHRGAPVRDPAKPVN